MGIWTKLLGGGTGNLVKAVGDVVDEFVTTGEERMELENEMARTQMEYNLEQKRLGIKEQEIYLQDTASAREAQAAIQTSEHASWLAKNVGSILALGTTLLAFFLFFWVISGHVTDKNQQIVIYILGALSAITTQIFSYYFGSSQGSAKKNQMLEDISKRDNQLVEGSMKAKK
jgi:heme/copper-type cytochrome/quinol oxidase subunit 4